MISNSRETYCYLLGEKAISEFPLASFSKRVLELIISYDYEFSFKCNLQSFSYEWPKTRPRFKKER